MLPEAQENATCAGAVLPRVQVELSHSQMNPRLPSLIRLPFGYNVKVVQVSQRRMRELTDVEPGNVVCGLWFVESRTIYIWNKLSPKEKRSTLWHELQHVLVDAKDEQTQQGLARIAGSK